MVNYHGFYHLVLRHEPVRPRPEADTVRMLEEMFDWEWECIEKHRCQPKEQPAGRVRVATVGTPEEA